MRIGIFGMGYVGVVTGACLLRDGHYVVGVDPVSEKVNDLANGHTPIQEPQVAEMLAAGHGDGRLGASTEPIDGLRDADLALICVGTPSKPDGGMDLIYIKRCIEQIGKGLRMLDKKPLIVMRSTSLPGTTADVVIPVLERASGLVVGQDIDVVFHPEFLREGKAVYDFDNPPKIVVGEHRTGAGDRLMDMYPPKYNAPRFRLSLPEAEMVKYCDNLFHAVKVTFANEVGAVAQSVGVDARRVADVFCSDTKLNINASYLRPGFAFGGSCLPKDLRAISRFSSQQGVRAPMLNGVLESNVVQIDRLVSRVLSSGAKRIGMVGLAFKPDTDDMRESPYAKVAKALIGEGAKLSIYDTGIATDRLIGANRMMVQSALGHLEELLVSDISELGACELILINHPRVSVEQVDAWIDSGVRVLDLASIEGVDCTHDGYEGIYW